MACFAMTLELCLLPDRFVERAVAFDISSTLTRYPNEEQAQKAMVALADKLASVESIVTQKLPMIPSYG